MAKKDYLNLRGLTTYDSESKQYIKDQISDGIDNLRTTAYKTEAEWSKANPVLKKGEWAYSSDKAGMYKLGNGTSKWSELGYNHVTWANVEGKPSTFSPTAHKHTKSDITDFPSTMKNPNTLTIKTNGTSQAVYDGGVAKEVNITPSNIGLGNVNNTADKDKSVKYAESAGMAKTATSADGAADSDKLDGYHEQSFMRFRSTQNGTGPTSHSDTLWEQIGIKQYNDCLPDAMADKATYEYGAVVSFPGANSRFDIWYNHQTSENGNGLRYRTGWNVDKRAWATIIDSLNIQNQSVAYATSSGTASTVVNGGTGTADQARHVWFSNIDPETSRVSSDKFMYNPATDTLTVGNITGKAGSVDWANVNGKPSSYTPSSHTHTKSQITDFPTSMPASDVYAWAKAASKPSYSWNEITGKPSSFTPASHSHTKLNREDHLNSIDKLNAFIEASVFKYATISNVGDLDGIILSIPWNTSSWGQQIYLDDSSFDIAHRHLNNGTWSDWKRLIDTYNYTDYTVTKNGSGASGTWNISISGNAATATTASSANSVDWSKVQNKPSTYPATAHTHDDRYYTESEIDGKLAKYLPKSGGTMEGTAFITWPDTGNWSNSNTGVTFPVNRGGLQWSGQSDGIQLYAVETGNDNLELYLKFLDDNSNGLSIRNAKGNETARIFASGVISASSFVGTLTGDITGHAYGVRDYNNSKNIIQIGYSGAGLTTANLSHIAGYTDNGTKIKDVSKEVLRSWIGLGSAAYTSSDSYALSSHTHDDRYYTETEINDKVTALNNSIATKVTEKTVNTAVDLNTLTDTGVYHIKTSISSALHGPTTGHGTLYVDFSVGTPYQLFVPDANTLNWYKRWYNGSSKTWAGWITIYNSDTVYTHPSYTAYTSGLYKITTNSLGHVTSATAVTKSDITALGIPGSDTNTWRGIQNNLTSDSTSDSLAAAQGKALKGMVDAVNKKVDGIEVGGRNIATKTNQGATGWSWSSGNGGDTIEEVVENGVRTCKMTRRTNTERWSVIQYSYIGRSKWEPNTVYTVSVDVKASCVTSFYPWFRRGDMSDSLIKDRDDVNVKTVKNAWIKLIWVVRSADILPEHTDQNTYFVGMNSSAGTWYQFRNLKIEKGNKATDWTPAPEDIDDSISSLSSRITTNTNSISSLKTTVSNKLDTSTFENYKSHTHKSIIDSGNSSSATTFAYSKAGMNYGDYTWLAGWNGYELRAVAKNQFATFGHNHDSVYSKLGHGHAIADVSGLQGSLDGKLSLSGGTMTGALTFANGIWNTVGDDVAIGDHNISGSLGVKGLNGNTKITLVPHSGSTANTISNDGAGNLTISGTTNGTFKGSLSGNASTATALTSSAGSATQPVYFSGGKPVACSYTLGKSVPSNAVFTDTNTWRGIQNNLTSDSTSDSLSAAQGKVLKGLVDGKAASGHTHSFITRSEILDTVDKLNNFIEPGVFKYTTMNALNGLDGLENNDGIILSAPWHSSTNYGHQMYLDDNGYTIAHRYRNNGTWSSWVKLIDSSNYTSYTVTKTGSGASGTWGINVTGSAGSVAWGNVSGRPSSLPASDVYAWAKASSKPSYSWGEITGKPSSFTPSSHTHSYLPLSGGTMTGALNFTINTNSIYCSGNDSVNGPGGALNNLVINSWYGVSFTSTCDSTYKGKTAVGINCREGIVKANTFEGKLAATAVYVNGNITATGSLRANADITTSSIELYAAKPFVDFHFDGNNGDYTSRIIENAAGILNINGATFTSGGSVWCTSFSTDGGGTFGRNLSASNGLYLKHAKTSLFLYNENGSFCMMHTGTDGNNTWPIVWDFKNDNLAIANSINCGAYGTFAKGIVSKAESIFHTGSYTDPLPGVTCAIKVSGIATATRFYVKGRSSTWLSGAQPGGAGFECVNDTDSNALIPGWRIRNASGAWVGGSYNMDKCFHLYYAKAERLSGNTNNGTDADFIFNANTGNFATKSLTQTSDERRKSVISSSILDTYKDFFMKIKPFSFKWKDGQDDGATHLGVGAQSVFHTALECGFEESDIGLVQRGKEYPGTSIPWSVSYTEFIPLNIAVTQDHETRIKKLERENEELKQQIKELKGLTA